MSTSTPEPQNTQPPTGSAHKAKRRTKSRTAVNRRLNATKTKKGAQAAKPAAGAVARAGTKTAKVLHLLERSGGATLTELMKATNWQAHSVRGFLSGTLRKKMALAVTSTKTADGQRSYTVKA